ncbi:D-serine ammonia-lyase [Pseudomonas mediterranea]|uniref:D-serine ammonia-lyase n=1 Tax=Pseudomonas mediterranea TaxID=183795 RepID=UPI0006D8A777|nr:D-serine ammonia-lyase [Pseudomonas mediterranea]MDU9027493.1 D-serine ammonia-lyase [Pseudomonas mediterranea]
MNSPQFSDAKSALKAKSPVLWINDSRKPSGEPGTSWGKRTIGKNEIQEASQRLVRFSRVLLQLFPELEATNGVIESPLIRTPNLQHALGVSETDGKIFIKADHGLPVAGSIKARGGIHEVLEFAERIAIENKVITSENPDSLLSEEGRALLSKYSVAVGSTGNLGLSIGVIASALGFDTTVHMSADAKEWKKKRLRDRDVKVVEHEGDYAAAVAAGREEAMKDPLCHFVDDESSFSLFAGYSVAPNTLQQQLRDQQITVDGEHPLFIYIPCGVGGAPGGIAFGAAHTFGPNVHCFFAEPTASPCFMVAMMDEPAAHSSVYDLGLDNRTEADGLAVPRASECAVSVMRSTLSGVFSVEDETLFKHVHTAAESEGLRIEPSAAAAFDGPQWLIKSPEGQSYLATHNLTGHLNNATHVIWTTGGLFVPEAEYLKFYERGAALKG